MSFFSEIYLSKFLNQPVYTIDEKFLGYFRDFIVVFDKQSRNYKVTKIRVKLPKKEHPRITIPWEKVQSIETEPIIFKLKEKLEDVTTCEYADNEFRLKRDMLDQQIIDTNNHKVVRVNDLKLVAVKNEIYMVAAEVGLKSLIRRLGLGWLEAIFSRWLNIKIHDNLIPSKYIEPFSASLRHDIQLNVAHDKLNKMHPSELADIIEQLDHYEQFSILHNLDPESLAETIAALSEEARVDLLSKFKDETVTNLLEKLDPDDATDIITDLPKKRMKTILKMMRREEAKHIEELIKFEENTAGSLMNTEYVSFSGEITVKETLQKLKKYSENAELLFYLYIIDDEGKLTGAISLKNLIFSDEETKLKDLIKHKPISVKVDDETKIVVEKLTNYELIALPVVDNQHRMKGVITTEDVLKEINPY